MEWGTLAAVVVGAVFGIGATLLTDHVRHRRESDQRWAETKRLVYGRFLVALAQAHSRMVMVAFHEQSPDERRRAVHHAFHTDPQHSEAKSVVRELGITAPDAVYQAGLRVYEQLRVVRDALALPAIAVGTEEYRSVVEPFFAGLDNLQRVMREDLRPTRGLGRGSDSIGDGLPTMPPRIPEFSSAE